MNQLPEKDLPPGRHRLLKEHLMTEIRQEPRVRRVWLRPALVAGAVAAVTAVTLTFAVPSGSGESAPPVAKPTSAAPQTAATLLEDIALAAEHASVPAGIRDDQFVYIKSKVAWSSQDGDGPAKLDPIHEREVWLSVDGEEQGLLHEPFAGHDDMLLEAPTPGIPSNTNYRHLQTLPTDPDKVYTWLNEVSGDGSKNKDDANFVLVGDLARESLMPPAQTAALYRAAAKISGVFVIDDAVDAAGRHGIAVARVEDGERHELIFDKKTKEYLGEREVAVQDLPWGPKKGDVTAQTAVLERTVVDKRGERP
ncbi:CU044_5270 family protein [Streptomyces sp. S.PB5]|uniref:CU044_5270 family protein n=1 Tax=Streptomyces sp. S.PB5 TaxID=3020844 RepID=UPI0025AF1506|nr:CU044_5270 family protein [Streptomyces sp. S.PB5]MDN3028866.1 CU044_5270 family protein [Streptomyces sp. S.PB5]